MFFQSIIATVRKVFLKQICVTVQISRGAAMCIQTRHVKLDAAEIIEFDGSFIAIYITKPANSQSHVIGIAMTEMENEQVRIIAKTSVIMVIPSEHSVILNDEIKNVQTLVTIKCE